MKSKKLFQWIRILLFTVVLVGVCVLGFILTLRPTISETEGRELTKFPTFTWESFLSGEYTSQISLWYADTFPGREGFIKAYHGIRSLFGLRGEQFQQGDVGDDIPDGPMDPNAPEEFKRALHGGADYYPMYYFMDAILNDKTPPMDVYKAVETAAPAILAVESANKGGIMLEVPDFRA